MTTTTPTAHGGFVRHHAPKDGPVGHRVPGLSAAYRAAESGNLEEACDLLETIIDEQEIPLNVLIHLRRSLIEWYGALAQPVPAVRLATQNARDACREYGDCDELSLMLRSSELYWRAQGGYAKETIPRFAKLRRDVEAALGRNDILAWTVRNNSAMPHKVLGQYGEAARIYGDLLLDLRRKLKGSDPVVLTTRDNYAEVLAADGRIEDSTREYRECLRNLLEVTDADDRRVLRIRHEIACNTYVMGDEDEAREMWDVLAEDCRRYLGECDDMTVRQRQLQVMMAIERRDSAAVVQWCERLLDNLPPGHPAEEAAVFRGLMEQHRERLASNGG